MTILVGENGSGKSTLVEAIAVAYRMSPEGGSTGARRATRATESPLSEQISLGAAGRVAAGPGNGREFPAPPGDLVVRLAASAHPARHGGRRQTRSPTVRHPGSARWGYSLRAETMHAFCSYLETNLGTRPEPRFHEMSHGESFLAMVADRFRSPGRYVMDGPEAALSFNTVAPVEILREMEMDGNRQAIVATHSPILAALPGPTGTNSGTGGCGARRGPSWPWLPGGAGFLADPHRFLSDWRAHLSN